MTAAFRPGNPVTATRTLLEGGPAYVLEGSPDVLADLVEELPFAACDHDHSEVFGRPGLCSVWGASTSSTYDDVADAIRLASDRASIDVVFAVLGDQDTLPAPPEPTIKACGCGLSYTASTWAALKLCGHQFGLELRNCRCGSTITIPVSEEVQS